MTRGEVTSYQFNMNSHGRYGTITCSQGDQHMDIDWEISGVPEHHILLAPMDLKTWHSGQFVPREHQIQILHALRAWLATMNIRSDISQISDITVGTSKCMRRGRNQPALTQSAYCLSHYDENLLR